jgi:hypothetical protein
MYVSALAGGLCAILLIVYIWLPESAGVTKRNFDRVQIGMSYAEVVDIFCATERWIDGNAVYYGDFGDAWIHFDEQHRVSRKEWIPIRGP